MDHPLCHSANTISTYEHTYKSSLASYTAERTPLCEGGHESRVDAAAISSRDQDAVGQRETKMLLTKQFPHSRETVEVQMHMQV